MYKTCIHTLIFMYTYTYVNTRNLWYTHVYTCIYTRTFLHMYTEFNYISTFVRVHICVCECNIYAYDVQHV